MNDGELERLLRTPERRVPLAPFGAVDARARRGSSALVPALAVVAAIVVGLVAGVRLADLRQQQVAAPSPSHVASASPSATATAAISPTAPPGFVVHENRVLGYRITLPAGYRRSLSRVETTPGAARAGLDIYTLRTEAEQKAECERDAGHVGGPGLRSDVMVRVQLDTGGQSPMEWVTTPQFPGAQPRSTHQRVESLTVGGHEAVKLTFVASGDTSLYVIRANDRLYEVGPVGSGQPVPGLGPDWVDPIARSFTAIAPAPFPTPSPQPQAPREAAQRLANELAAAFAARDAAAVARLMPECWVVGSYLVDGEQPGMGGINRAVKLFEEGLRLRFARGDLSVTVDTELQTDMRTLGGYFVRSQWREPDRTIRVDLGLMERDGRWIWWSFLHHFSRSDLGGGGCAPLRSPWVSGSC